MGPQSDLSRVRRRTCVRVGTRGGIEVGAVLSCGLPIEWGRTEQELSCGEPFDDMHRCAAHRTIPG